MEKVNVFIKIRVLFWPEISALGVFFNFDNERRRPPKYPSAPPPGNTLDWVHSFTALGIDYNVLDNKNMTKTNIENKIESMKCITKAWGCRNITPIGRITVL